MQKEEKKNETKRRRSERRNWLQKSFHSFKYITDHTNVHFFFLISLRTYSQSLNDINICTVLCDSFCTTCCIFPAQIALQLSQFIAIQFFFFWVWIFKNHPQGRVSCNANLSNIGSVLQRNLKTNRGSECIFRVFGGTNFESIWRYKFLEYLEIQNF